MSTHVIDPAQTPRYTVAQAARLAQTSPQNLRRWLFGYQAPGHQMIPVLGTRESTSGPVVSFLDLCELAVVAAFRRATHPVKLDRLRRAHAYAQREMDLVHPFADERILAEGGHILLAFAKEDGGPGTLVLDEGGQVVLPWPVTETVHRFDFEGLERQATRWFMYGRTVPVVVDPRVGSGLPTILGRNLRTDFIVGRFAAGEDISSLADDYDLDPVVIEAAVRASLPAAA